jgi:hypothetical protein
VTAEPPNGTITVLKDAPFYTGCEISGPIESAIMKSTFTTDAQRWVQRFKYGPKGRRTLLLRNRKQMILSVFRL